MGCLFAVRVQRILDTEVRAGQRHDTHVVLVRAWKHVGREIFLEIREGASVKLAEPQNLLAFRRRLNFGWADFDRKLSGDQSSILSAKSSCESDPKHATVFQHVLVYLF